MTPGERIEALWSELHRAISPLTHMLATRTLKRAAALAAVARARAVLDRMERILNGEE